MKRVYPLTIQSGMSQSDSYILMLGEAGTGVQIPIFIGGYEAQSILLAQEGVDTRRPLTHRLMSNLMDEYALTLQQVTIDRVSEGIFYATLHVSDGFNTKQLDSRTSDAIVLALLKGCPILVAEQVIEETGVKSSEVGGRSSKTSAQTLEALEAELRRCEEREDYERAAEIQRQIEKLKR